jgi:catechol 2,3-dioxygenase-like lactoylglutathione lyase family enzyme
MTIIPTVRCRQMAASIRFYTQVLDFEHVDGSGYEGAPAFCMLGRNGAPLFLSSHTGDGAFGQAVAILTDDVDALVRKFRARGLKTPGDPDGNTLRFTQGFRLPPPMKRAG